MKRFLTSIIAMMLIIASLFGMTACFGDNGGGESDVDEDGNGAYELLYDRDPAEVNAYYNSLFPEVDEPACYRSFDPTVQSYVNTLWENLKISGSTETWVHVTSITITALVIGYAAYSIYVKKKRSRHYRKKKI